MNEEGMTEQNALVVYRFRDARPGHEKQTLGLLQGLAALTPVRVHEFRLYATPDGPLDRAELRRALDLGRTDPPQLILGAGHGLHLPMLWLRLRRGGRIVVLMKPSLPARLFDLVLVPEHDLARAAANVLRTQGMLCPVPPADAVAPARDLGLVLVGGRNRYFAWRNDRVARQVDAVVRAMPELEWVITDSRRTPDGFGAALELPAGARFVPWESTESDWLQHRLAQARCVWVTADSASMLYEALSAGAQVGVLELPSLRPNSKLHRGIERLEEISSIVLSTTTARLDLAPRVHPMRESQRCAEALLQRWFPQRLPAPA